MQLGTVVEWIALVLSIVALANQFLMTRPKLELLPDARTSDSEKKFYVYVRNPADVSIHVQQHRGIGIKSLMAEGNTRDIIEQVLSKTVNVIVKPKSNDARFVLTLQPEAKVMILLLWWCPLGGFNFFQLLPLWRIVSRKRLDAISNAQTKIDTPYWDQRQ